MHKSLPVIGALVFMAGCAAGPDYHAPQTPAPAQFAAARSSAPFDADQENQFWQGFNDPLLASLINQTLAANQTLQAALARYQRADALLRGSKADQLPEIGLNASASEQHLADVQRTPAGSGPQRVTLYQGNAVASWELDVFGGLRRASEAQQARLQAAGADLTSLQVALVGQLASSYFTLRGQQQQLQVAEQNVDIQQQTLDIVASRVAAGRGTEFDRVRARAQLQRTRAAIPALQAEISARMHHIAVLTGQAPTALLSVLSTPQPLPATVPAIPVGSPGDVLRRRPDIRVAERQLAAATADIGVASADLFPHFTLDGLIGSVAADSSDLFTGPATTRSIGLGIDWSFLNVGRVRSRIDAADAQSQVALANYQQAVLSALEETETRLVRYQRAQQRSDLLASASEAADEAARLARERYKEGYIGYYEVLAAEQERVDSRDALERSRTTQTLAMVNVYRALAGAPEPAATTATADPL